MSRGPGKLQRWLVDEALTTAPQTIARLAHRWLCARLGQECGGGPQCVGLPGDCGAYGLWADMSATVSMARAVRSLEKRWTHLWRSGRLYVVATGDTYHRGPLVAHGPPYAWLMDVAQTIAQAPSFEDIYRAQGVLEGHEDALAELLERDKDAQAAEEHGFYPDVAAALRRLGYLP